MTIAPALTRPLRDEHRELLPNIEMLRSTADLVGLAMIEQVCGLLDEAHGFLVQRVIPHAGAEERVLYPVIEEAMGAPGATQAMGLDHVAIARGADELDWLRGQLHGSTLTLDQAMALRRVLYGLHAILKLHFQKVEELYLPVLDCWLTQERARILFGHMADRAATANASVPRAG